MSWSNSVRLYFYLYVPWESLNSPPHQIINALQCKFESLEWCTDDLLLFELSPSKKKIESVLHSYIHNVLSFFCWAHKLFSQRFLLFSLSFNLLFITMEWNYLFYRVFLFLFPLFKVTAIFMHILISQNYNRIVLSGHR